MPSPTPWYEQKRATLGERRKEKRVPLAFPIEVSGFNTDGYFFREESSTSDISENGCRFRLSHEVETEGVVAIKVARRDAMLLRPEQPLLFRIAWMAPEDDGWAFGAVKLQPDNIWRMAFPQTATAGLA